MNIGDSQTNFLTLWEDGSLCDVELRTADGVLVPAHRVVLAASSAFFRALFLGSGKQMREGMDPGNIIDLPGVDEASLRALLKVVYSNNYTSDIENGVSIGELLAAASYLSVGPVREACTQYLQRSLSLGTAVETLKLAEQFDCAELRVNAMHFVQSHFTPLLTSSSTGTLQLLPHSLIKEILSSDALEVSSEAEVAQAAAVWIFGDVTQRAQQALSLLSAMRAPLPAATCAASIDAAAASLDPYPYANQISILHSSFNAALAELEIAYCSSGTAAPPISLNFSPRLGSPTELMVVGGVDEWWRSLKTVELYDPRTDQWRTGTAMLAPCSFAAACTLGGRAYAIEGSAHLPVAQQYDRHAKRWCPMPRPSTARVNMATAALPSFGVLILGGRVGTGRAGISLSSVDRYDPEEGVWREDSWMGSARSALAACALPDRQKIFALGGQTDRITLDSCEWFDPGTNQWYPIADKMSCPKKYLGAASAEGQVVVVGGMTGARQRLADVQAYDPREGRWRTLPNMLTPRSSFGVSTLNGEVFVAGGSVGEGVADEGMECLSLVAGKWRKCAPMVAGRTGLSMTHV